jgi:hypothetical protein
MDGDRCQIREFRDEDYAAEAHGLSRVYPERPSSVEEVRRWSRIVEAAPGVRVDWVAESRPAGEILGFGHLNTDP